MTTKKSPSKMNTYLPSIEGRATSILSRLQARQERYPEGLITDAIQVIKRLEGIAKKQNALRHTIQQLEGQLRIKDMQIAELKKQYADRIVVLEGIIARNALQRLDGEKNHITQKDIEESLKILYRHNEAATKTPAQLAQERDWLEKELEEAWKKSTNNG